MGSPHARAGDWASCSARLAIASTSEGQCSGTVTWAGTAGGDTCCIEIVMSHNWELRGDRYPHLGNVGRSEAALMVLPDNGTDLHMRFPALNSSGVKVRIPKCS